MFRVRDAAESKKKCKRRLKRSSEGKKESEAQDAAGQVFHLSQLVLADELEALPSHTIRCAAKVRGFAFDPSYKAAPSSSSGGAKAAAKEGCRALVSLINNSLEIYQVPYPEEVAAGAEAETVGPNKLSVVDLHGHRYAAVACKSFLLGEMGGLHYNADFLTAQERCPWGVDLRRRRDGGHV